ncbi:MAG: sensor histidine kinase, partial [Acidimicrobiales bacterium]
VMGAVTLIAPRSQRLSADDERLAYQVASGMGLALRNQQLTDALRRRVDELRGSRRRIVKVQDDTRRTLERDLHDGAQQHLVAVKVKLGIARQIAERDAASGTATALDTISRDADHAIDEMRTFARGIYPPLLEAEGLVAAITAHARRLPITVDIAHYDIGRYDRDIETTIFFCMVEALDNVTAHTTATTATVDLTETRGTVRFTVTNPPPGYDSATTPPGTGHTMMRDRLDVLEGTLTTTSTPTGVTTITGTATIDSVTP